MTEKIYTPTEQESAAISIIKSEFDAWKTGEIQVTDKVSFSMRERIKQTRKNYWGVFDVQKDPADNEKKWTHLTFQFTEMFVKNIDIDTKDINTKARKPEDYGMAAVARFVVRYFLDKLGWGEILNDLLRRVVIDGTVVHKILEGTGDEIIQSDNVDLLNFFIDPHAKSIRKTNAVIERHIMDIDDFKTMKWDNKDCVMGREDIKTYFDLDKKVKGGKVPQVDIYERWGKIPKYLLTGKEEDKNKWIQGIIICSGMDNNNIVIHKLMKNPKKDQTKPYEEGWFIRVPGRWYGVGIPELLFETQEQLN